jgi:transposase
MTMGKRGGTQGRRRCGWRAKTCRGVPAHPFYARLNQILDKHDFDRFVAGLCRRFYAEDIGRPGLPPGRYFRLLLIGYFVEGSDAERAIAWLAADSLSCANFSDCAPVCPA